MKKIFTLIVISCFSLSSIAQVSLGGQPFSASADYLNNEVPSLRLDSPDMQVIHAEDDLAESEGKPPRYAVHIPVNLNMDNAGEWTFLDDGSKVWRLRIEAPNALATTLFYNSFQLPERSKLYIYNDDMSSTIGAFSGHNNADGGNYATQLVQGEAFTIEYYQAYNVKGTPVLDISHVGYCYRFNMPPNVEERGGSQSCEVDINCSEGNNWQDEKKGVLGMSIATNFGSSWCTASLVNNTALDCKNYILSAMHCTESSSAANFGQYVFYFNYETTNCGSGSPNTSQSVTGCVLRADSDDGGGSSGSDFALMEHTGAIPTSYDPYYNGWNAQTSASASGVGIHHPAGDRKKISTYTSQLTTTGWGISNTHWRVYWSATANGHGVTEGGSSGSPLFDNSGRIVGTLTGGGSYCSQVPNPSPDSYGKMSYHWQSNPGDDLKDWLDPGNSGQLTLAGTYAPCTPANQYDAGISSISSPTTAVCDNSITPVITLTNYGSATLTNITIYYNVDGSGTQTYNWTGNLSINQSETITLPSVAVSAGSHTFNAYTGNPNGQQDANSNNDNWSSGFTATIADTFVTLVLNTDDYGAETTWNLTLNGGGVVASGGPYNNNEEIEVDLCVQSGDCYTFTIDDSQGDGICCGYGTGSYSLGNANGISINSGGEFTFQEQTNFCVPTSGGDCDTLYNPFGSNSSGFYIYSNQGGGYIAGSNSFGDLAKAQEFTSLGQPAEITGVVFWIAAKTDDGAEVTANLYDLDGAGTDLGGSTNNAPGTILASGSKDLLRIDLDFFNVIEFNNPVTLSSGFAVGLDFSDFGTNDELGIVTNGDGDANGNELAWEKWSTGDWYTMNQAWNTQSDGDFDLGIFPVVCPQNVTDITDLDQFFSLFPNPTDGQFSIINSAGFEGNLMVFNTMGQKVLDRGLNGDLGIKVDLSSFESGIYLVRISTDNGDWITRVVLK